jgi:hypothetical protein
MGTVCPDCGVEYKQLGKHLTGNCSIDIDTELIDSFLIGDGTLDNGGSGNYRLTVSTTERKYVKYVEDKLDWLHLSTKSYESEDKKKLYNIRTICSSVLTKQYKRWYPNGNKRIPEDFKVTPFSLKQWYCADGHLKDNSTNPRFSIGLKNESNRREFIENIFPFEASYVGYEICFKTRDTEKIKDYMGSPPPGFEYKWP